MDAYRQMYPASSMQGYRVQAQQGHQFPAMWSQAQLLALYQQNPQRAAAVMMGHSPIHASKQTEPKPRLAKDEVEVLEREFAKNQKPNSSVKRDLAEKMGVEVPRINVCSALPPLPRNQITDTRLDGRTGFRTGERRRSR